MLNNLHLSLLIVLYLGFVVHKNLSALSDEYLKVHFFPVGDGDATIIECYDNPSDKSTNISLTLINAGSKSSSKKSIQIEYFKFLYSLLSDSKYKLDNIIISNSNPKYYNFLEPFVSAKQTELKRIRFYVGGRRTSYLLDDIFENHDFVYEFTRKDGRHTDIHSCGHYAKNKRDFYNCIKKGRYGVVDDSDEVIQICDKFQISVIAANYETWFEEKDYLNQDRNNKSSVDTVLEKAASPPRKNDTNYLVLKVTPTEKSQPSILLGNFENNDKVGPRKGNYDYYSLIKDAHDYHTKAKNNPVSLGGGLASTLISMPQLDIIPEQKSEDFLYSNLVQPSLVVSNGDTTGDESPSCEALDAVDRYLTMFSTSLTNTYQCQAKTGKKDTENTNIQFVRSSDNIYQTCVIDLSNSSQAEKKYNLYTFKMTSNEVTRLIQKVVFKESKIIPVNVRYVN